MRILFLSPYPAQPLYGGAVVRNHYLSLWLKSRHRVWASFQGVTDDPEFEGEVPNRFRGWRSIFNPELIRDACAVIKKNKIEAVVATSLVAGLNAALISRITGVPLWMDEHNVEWRCSRLYGQKTWPLVYLLEGFVLKSASFLTCVSKEDRDRLARDFRIRSDKIVVANNGVDWQSLSRGVRIEPPVNRKIKRILFFGVLSYPPNRRAVELIESELLPRLKTDTEFLIAGVGGQQLAQRFPNLTFLDYVGDIHSLIRESDGVVVPIVAGGGTRLKILEAVACGCPVISTTCGAEGLEREVLGDALTVTDSWKCMAEWIDRLPQGEVVSPAPSFPTTYDWNEIWQGSAPF